MATGTLIILSSPEDTLQWSIQMWMDTEFEPVHSEYHNTIISDWNQTQNLVNKYKCFYHWYIGDISKTWHYNKFKVHHCHIYSRGYTNYTISLHKEENFFSLVFKSLILHSGLSISARWCQSRIPWSKLIIVLEKCVFIWGIYKYIYHRHCMTFDIHVKVTWHLTLLPLLCTHSIPYIINTTCLNHTIWPE